MSELAKSIAAFERRLNVAMLGDLELHCVWCDEDQTTEEAIARDYPNGVPAHYYVVGLRWASTQAQIERSRRESARLQGAITAEIISYFKSQNVGLAGWVKPSSRR